MSPERFLWIGGGRIPHRRPAYRLRSIICGVSILVACVILMGGTIGAGASSLLLGGCQCTDYVYSQRPDISRGMGNANQWISSAVGRGFLYDQIPQVGDVAVFLNGSHSFNRLLGHVAMVTWVNGDHTRYNISGWNGDVNDCQLQSYSNFSVLPGDWFIHRSEGQSQPPSAAPAVPAQPSSGQIQFSPVSPSQAGQIVTLTVKIQPGFDYRAARLLIDYQVVGESSATQFSHSWNTSGLLPSVHAVRLEIATKDDASWARPSFYETTYLLREAVQPPNRAPDTPTAISPSDGQTLGANPSLCWKNNGDPDGDAVMSRAEVSGPESWIGPWLDGDAPCWSPPVIKSGQYSWSVRARDNKGAESNGSLPWNFKIGSMQPTASALRGRENSGIWSLYWAPSYYLEFEQSKWSVASSGIATALVSRGVESCSIGQGGPMGLPEDFTTEVIGEIRYLVVDRVSTDERYMAYFALDHGDEQTHNSPFFLVHLPASDPGPCLDEAKLVLSSLRAKSTSTTAATSAEIWPNTLVGTWEATINHSETFRPMFTEHARVEIRREPDGRLTLSTSREGVEAPLQQGDYRPYLSSVQYYFCFFLDQAGRRPTEALIEMCLNPSDADTMELQTSGLGGHSAGVLRRIGP